MKSYFNLSDLEVYNNISECFKMLKYRLEKKNLSYEKMKGALIPNQDKDKFEMCFVFDTSKISTDFYGYYIFEKLIPLLDKKSTYSILYGDYVDVLNTGCESQECLYQMLYEKLVSYNLTEFEYSNQFFLIYFNRLSKSQREQIIEELSSYSWFIGYVDVTHCSRFKTYISYILMHLCVKCENQIIVSHPADCSDDDNINMSGYPFEENKFSISSINDESFYTFLSYKIETFVPDEADIGFSFNALFPRFDSVKKLKLKVSDEKWSEYLAKDEKGKKGALLQTIGYSVNDKERFIKDVYKLICSNYIYNLQKDDYGNLRFNVCVEISTINGNYRKTTIALKYLPDSGEMFIITVT